MLGTSTVGQPDEITDSLMCLAVGTLGTKDANDNRREVSTFKIIEIRDGLNQSYQS